MHDRPAWRERIDARVRIRLALAVVLAGSVAWGLGGCADAARPGDPAHQYARRAQAETTEVRPEVNVSKTDIWVE